MNGRWSCSSGLAVGGVKLECSDVCNYGPMVAAIDI